MMGINQLVVTPISQLQAKQKVGRASRTSPGKCYRLYTRKGQDADRQRGRDPEDQLGEHGAVSEGDGHQQPAVLQLYGHASHGDADRGHGAALLGALDDEGRLTRWGGGWQSYRWSPRC